MRTSNPEETEGEAMTCSCCHKEIPIEEATFIDDKCFCWPCAISDKTPQNVVIKTTATPHDDKPELPPTKEEWYALLAVARAAQNVSIYERNGATNRLRLSIAIDKLPPRVLAMLEDKP